MPSNRAYQVKKEQNKLEELNRNKELTTIINTIDTILLFVSRFQFTHSLATILILLQLVRILVTIAPHLFPAPGLNKFFDISPIHTLMGWAIGLKFL